MNITLFSCICRHPSQKTKIFLDKLNDRLVHSNQIKSFIINHSKTLLDHILMNEQTLEVTPGVTDFQISDQCLTFAMLRSSRNTMQKKPFKETKIYQFRCFRNFESFKFCEDLKKI